MRQKNNKPKLKPILILEAQNAIDRELNHYRKARSLHEKQSAKAKWVFIPGDNHNTQILIRPGEDTTEKIQQYKNKRIKY